MKLNVEFSNRSEEVRLNLSFDLMSSEDKYLFLDKLHKLVKEYEYDIGASGTVSSMHCFDEKE